MALLIKPLTIRYSLIEIITKNLISKAKFFELSFKDNHTLTFLTNKDLSRLAIKCKRILSHVVRLSYKGSFTIQVSFAYKDL